MILLDTCVISALMRPQDNRPVVAWLDRQSSVSIWTTAVTVLEIRFGLLTMPEGRRRSKFEQAFDGLLQQDLEGRIAAFDLAAAEAAATLAAERQRKGRPIDVRDTQIAGVALARRAAIATRNAKHFDDLSIPIVDPWAA
jgi:predicted nucleic acid-binding protein